MILKKDIVGQKYGIRDSYRTYRRLCDEPQALSIYLEIVYGFMKFILQKALEGYEVVLPVRMGKLFIMGKKIRVELDENGNILKAAPNWAETRKLWARCPECKERNERIFHLNEHTNGIRYKIKWCKTEVLIKNKDIYSFQFANPNKPLITEQIRDGKEYFVMPEKVKIQKNNGN